MRTLFENHRSILLLILIAAFLVSCEKGRNEDQPMRYSFHTPYLLWDESRSWIEQIMSDDGYELLTSGDYYLVYKGKGPESRIGYRFQSDRLRGASVVVSSDSVSVDDVKEVFRTYTPVEGYDDPTFRGSDTVGEIIYDYEVKSAIDPKENGTYHLIAWAQYDMETAIAVDLGLSVDWADVNVFLDRPLKSGFNPEDVIFLASRYGWGDAAGDKTSVDTSEYPDLENICGSAYDIATINWGTEWRLPTEREMDELIYNCTWIWSERRGKKGYEVIGPSGNSIFLPACGYRRGKDVQVDSDGGYYWTGTLNPDTKVPYVLTFGESSIGLNSSGTEILRSYGCCVRPVRNR